MNKLCIVSVVVAYNRAELLSRCLTALERQSRRPDVILVVDNGSTDGSVDLVRKAFPKVVLLQSPVNLGGAGGFAAGVNWAIQHNFDWAWLMDDDAAPDILALSELEKAIAAKPNVPFVSSMVVDDESGSPLLGHDRRVVGAQDPHRNDVRAASFVGPLINVDAARNTYLPIPDFFIMHDDLEYTSRLSKHAPGFFCETAIICHPLKADLRDLGWRTYPAVRNQLWMALDPRLHASSGRLRSLRGALQTLVRQAQRSSRKDDYFRNALRGCIDGVFRRPKLYLPGQLPWPLTLTFRAGPGAR